MAKRYSYNHLRGMKPEVKMNMYEVQAILYWILGVLILHLGTWHWLGWISVGYGWFVLVCTIGYAIVEGIKRQLLTH